MSFGKKTKVSFDYRLRIKLGTLLLVFLILSSSLQSFRETFFFDSNLTGFENISFYEKRFEGVRVLLPRRGVVGYMSGPQPQVLDFDDIVEYGSVKANYRLAQYTLAPVILQPATQGALSDLKLVVVDKGKGLFPVLPDDDNDWQWLPLGAFSLLKDFKNGLLIYVRAFR